MNTNFVQIEFKLLTTSYLGNLCMRLAFNFMSSSRTYSLKLYYLNSQKLRCEVVIHLSLWKYNPLFSCRVPEERNSSQDVVTCSGSLSQRVVKAERLNLQPEHQVQAFCPLYNLVIHISVDPNLCFWYFKQFCTFFYVSNWEKEIQVNTQFQRIL